MQQIGENGLGAITGNWYSAQLDNPINKKFVAAIQRDYKVDPGVYAAETYLCGEVLDHAVKEIGGKIEDKDTFMKALKTAKVPDTLRGPVSFDEFGNVVGNAYLRKVEKKDGKYVNADHQDLSGRQPVLDLQAGGVPQGAGVLARLSAGEEPGVTVGSRRPRFHRNVRRGGPCGRPVCIVVVRAPTRGAPTGYDSRHGNVD